MEEADSEPSNPRPKNATTSLADIDDVHAKLSAVAIGESSSVTTTTRNSLTERVTEAMASVDINAFQL